MILNHPSGCHPRGRRATAAGMSIILAFLCIVPRSPLGAQTFKKYEESSRRDIETFMNRAERMNDRTAWSNYVELGIATERIEWEDAARDELYRKFQEIDRASGLSTDEREFAKDEAETLYEAARVEWEAGALEHVLVERGAFTARKEAVAGVDISEREYDAIVAAADAATSEKEYDLAAYQSGIRSGRDPLAERFESALTSSLAAARTRYVGLTPEEKAAFESELALREKAIRSEFEIRDSFFIKRAENRYIAVKRADDASARLAADQASADAVSDAVIADTESELQRTTERALNTAVESANNTLPGSDASSVQDAWQRQMEALVESGLRKWEKAEEDLYARRLAWMQEAKQTREEGERIWQTNHEKLKAARSLWLKNVQQQILDGRTRWEQKTADFQRSREAAERELTHFIASEQTKWAAGSRELTEMVKGGGAALLEAKDAYRYYADLLNTKGVPTNTECANPGTEDFKLRCFYKEQRDYMGAAISRFQGIMVSSRQILGDTLHSDNVTSGLLNDRRLYIDQKLVAQITGINEDAYKADLIALVTRHQEEDFLLYQRDLLNLSDRNHLYVTRVAELASSSEFKFGDAATMSALCAMIASMDVKYSDHKRHLLEITDRARDGLDDAAKLAQIKRDIEVWFSANQNENARLKREVASYFRDGLGGYFLTGNDSDPYLMTQAEYEWELLRRERNYLASRLRRTEEVKRYADLAARHETGLELAAVTEERRAVAVIRADLRELSYHLLKGDFPVNPLATGDPAVRHSEALRLLSTKGIDPSSVGVREARLTDEISIVSDVAALKSPSRSDLEAILARIRDSAGSASGSALTPIAGKLQSYLVALDSTDPATLANQWAVIRGGAADVSGEMERLRTEYDFDGLRNEFAAFENLLSDKNVTQINDELRAISQTMDVTSRELAAAQARLDRAREAYREARIDYDVLRLGSSGDLIRIDLLNTTQTLAGILNRMSEIENTPGMSGRLDAVTAHDLEYFAAAGEAERAQESAVQADRMLKAVEGLEAAKSRRAELDTALTGVDLSTRSAEETIDLFTGIPAYSRTGPRDSQSFQIVGRIRDSLLQIKTDLETKRGELARAMSDDRSAIVIELLRRDVLSLEDAAFRTAEAYVSAIRGEEDARRSAVLFLLGAKDASGGAITKQSLSDAYSAAARKDADEAAGAAREAGEALQTFLAANRGRSFVEILRAVNDRISQQNNRTALTRDETKDRARAVWLTVRTCIVSMQAAIEAAGRVPDAYDARSVETKWTALLKSTEGMQASASFYETFQSSIPDSKTHPWVTSFKAERRKALDAVLVVLSLPNAIELSNAFAGLDKAVRDTLQRYGASAPGDMRSALNAAVLALRSDLSGIDENFAAIYLRESAADAKRSLAALSPELAAKQTALDRILSEKDLLIADQARLRAAIETEADPDKRAVMSAHLDEMADRIQILADRAASIEAERNILESEYRRATGVLAEAQKSGSSAALLQTTAQILSANSVKFELLQATLASMEEPGPGTDVSGTAVELVKGIIGFLETDALGKIKRTTEGKGIVAEPYRTLTTDPDADLEKLFGSDQTGQTLAAWAEKLRDFSRDKDNYRNLPAEVRAAVDVLEGAILDYQTAMLFIAKRDASQAELDALAKDMSDGGRIRQEKLSRVLALEGEIKSAFQSAQESGRDPASAVLDVLDRPENARLLSIFSGYDSAGKPDAFGDDAVAAKLMEIATLAERLRRGRLQKMISDIAVRYADARAANLPILTGNGAVVDFDRSRFLSAETNLDGAGIISAFMSFDDRSFRSAAWQWVQGAASSPFRDEVVSALTLSRSEGAELKNEVLAVLQDLRTSINGRLDALLNGVDAPYIRERDIVVRDSIEGLMGAYANRSAAARDRILPEVNAITELSPVESAKSGITARINDLLSDPALTTIRREMLALVEGAATTSVLKTSLNSYVDGLENGSSESLALLKDDLYEREILKAVAYASSVDTYASADVPTELREIVLLREFERAEKRYALYVKERSSDLQAERDGAVLDLTGIMGDVARFVIARDFEGYIGSNVPADFIRSGEGRASVREYWGAFLRDRHTSDGLLPPVDAILERFTLAEYQRMNRDAAAAGGLWNLDERNYFSEFQNTIVLAKLDHFVNASGLKLAGASAPDRLAFLKSSLDAMLDSAVYAMDGKTLRERLLSSTEIDRFISVSFAYLEAGGGPGNPSLKEIYLPDVLSHRVHDGTLGADPGTLESFLPSELTAITGYATKDYRALAGNRSARLFETLAKVDVLTADSALPLTDVQMQSLIERAGYGFISAEVRNSIIGFLRARSTAEQAAGTGTREGALQVYRQNRILETLFQTQSVSDDVRVFLTAHNRIIDRIEERFFAELEKSHSDLRRLARESRGAFFEALIARMNGAPNAYDPVISSAGMNDEFGKLTARLGGLFTADERAHLLANQTLYRKTFDVRSGQELVTSGIFESVENAVMSGLLKSRSGGPVSDSVLRSVRENPNAVLRAFIKQVYVVAGVETADPEAAQIPGVIPGLTERLKEIAAQLDPKLKSLLIEENILVNRFLNVFQETDAERAFLASVLSDPALTQPGAHLSIDREAQKARIIAESDLAQLSMSLAGTLADHERAFSKDQNRFARDTEIGRRLANFSVLRGDDLTASRWGHFRTFVGSERGFQEAEWQAFQRDNPASTLTFFQFQGGLVLEGKAILNGSASGADAARNLFANEDWQSLLTSDGQQAAQTVQIETETPGVYKEIQVMGLKTLMDASTRSDRFTSGGVVDRRKMMESVYYEGLANNYIDAVSKLNQAMRGVFVAGRMAVTAAKTGAPALADKVRAVYDANASMNQSTDPVRALKMQTETLLAANNSETVKKKSNEASRIRSALEEAARDFASAGRRKAMLSMSESEYKTAYLDPAAAAFKNADKIVQNLQGIMSDQRSDHAGTSAKLADLMNRLGDVYRSFAAANEEAEARQAVSDYANTPYQDSKDAERRYQSALTAYQAAQSRLADAGFRVKTQDSLLVLDRVVRGLAENPPRSYAELTASDLDRLVTLRKSTFQDGVVLPAEAESELNSLTERELYHRYRSLIESRADYIRETARMVRIHKANEIIQAEVERRRIEAEEKKHAFEYALDAKMFISTSGRTAAEKKEMLDARIVTYQRLLMVEETGGSSALYDEFRSWFFLGPTAAVYGSDYAGGFFQNAQVPNVTQLQVAEFIAGTARANSIGAAEKASILTFLAKGGRTEEFSQFVPQYYSYLQALGAYDNMKLQQGLTFGTWMPVYSASVPAIQMYNALERLSSRLGPVAGAVVRALMSPLSVLVSLGMLAQQRMAEAAFNTMATMIGAVTASQNVWNYASAGSLASVRKAQAGFEEAQAKLNFFTKAASLDVLKARVAGFGSVSSDQFDQNKGRPDDDFVTENLYGLLPADLDGILTTLDVSGHLRESESKDSLGRSYDPDPGKWRSAIPSSALSNGAYLHEGINYTKIIDPDTGAVRFAPLLNGTGEPAGQGKAKSYNIAEIMDLVVSQGDKIRAAAKKKYFETGNAVAASGDKTFVLAERERTTGILLSDAGSDKNGGLEYSGYNMVFEDYDENVQEIFQRELEERTAVQRAEWVLREQDLTSARAEWEERVDAVLKRGRKAWSASEDRYLAEWRKWEKEYDRSVESGKLEWEGKIQEHFAAKDGWEKKVRDTATAANVNEIMGAALDDLDNQIAAVSGSIGFSFDRVNKAAALQSMIDNLRGQEPSGTERLSIVNRNIEKFSTLLAVSELTATNHFAGSTGLLQKFQTEMSEHRTSMRIFTGAKMMEEYQKLREKMIAAIEEENRQTEERTTADALQAGFSKQGSRFVKKDARGFDVGFVDGYAGFAAREKFDAALGAGSLMSTNETIKFLKTADEVQIESYFKTIRLKTQHAYETVMGRGTIEERRTSGESDARTHGTAGLWIGRAPSPDVGQLTLLVQRQNPGALGDFANNPYLNLATSAALGGGFGELGSSRVRPGGSPIGFYLQLSAISAFTNVVNQRTRRANSDLDADIVLLNQVNPGAALLNAYQDVKYEHDLNRSWNDAGRQLNGRTFQNNFEWKRVLAGDVLFSTTDAYLNSSESGRLWKAQGLSFGKGLLSSTPVVGALAAPLEIDMRDGSMNYDMRKDRNRDQMIGSFLGPLSSAYTGGFEYDAHGNRTNDGWTAEGRRGDEMALKLALSSSAGAVPVCGSALSATIEASYKKNNWHDDSQYQQISRGMTMVQAGAMAGSIVTLAAGGGLDHSAEVIPMDGLGEIQEAMSLAGEALGDMVGKALGSVLDGLGIGDTVRSALMSIDDAMSICKEKIWNLFDKGHFETDEILARRRNDNAMDYAMIMAAVGMVRRKEEIEAAEANAPEGTVIAGFGADGEPLFYNPKFKEFVNRDGWFVYIDGSMKNAAEGPRDPHSPRTDTDVQLPGQKRPPTAIEEAALKAAVLDSSKSRVETEKVFANIEARDVDVSTIRAWAAAERKRLGFAVDMTAADSQAVLDYRKSLGIGLSKAELLLRLFRTTGNGNTPFISQGAWGFTPAGKYAAPGGTACILAADVMALSGLVGKLFDLKKAYQSALKAGAINADAFVQAGGHDKLAQVLGVNAVMSQEFWVENTKNAAEMIRGLLTLGIPVIARGNEHSVVIIGTELIGGKEYFQILDPGANQRGDIVTHIDPNSLVDATSDRDRPVPGRGGNSTRGWAMVKSVNGSVPKPVPSAARRNPMYMFNYYIPEAPR